MAEDDPIKRLIDTNVAITTVLIDLLAYLHNHDVLNLKDYASNLERTIQNIQTTPGAKFVLSAISDAIKGMGDTIKKVPE